MQGSDIEMKKEYLLQTFLVMNQDLGRDWHYAPLAHWFPEHQLAGDMTGPLRLHNGKEAMNLGNPIFFFFFLIMRNKSVWLLPQRDIIFIIWDRKQISPCSWWTYIYFLSFCSTNTYVKLVQSKCHQCSWKAQKCDRPIENCLPQICCWD